MRSALSKTHCSCYIVLWKKSQKICLQTVWCFLSPLATVIPSLHMCVQSLTSSCCHLEALFSQLDLGRHHFHRRQNFRLRGDATTDWGPQTFKPNSAPVPAWWDTIYQREVEETSLLGLESIAKMWDLESLKRFLWSFTFCLKYI